MKWRNSIIYRLFHRKELKRQEEERRKREDCFTQFLARAEELCEEAMHDKEMYGEKPVFIDFGLYKLPVPLLKKGTQNGIRWYETRSGEILPEIVSV